MVKSEIIKFTVIAPVFCEEESLRELVNRIEQSFAGMGEKESFEILIVDDGSTDKTSLVLENLELENSFVRSVTLRRNCGKSMALMAGFEHAKGELIFTMDGDLQDNPEDMPELLKELDKGFDMVSGWRQQRQDQKMVARSQNGRRGCTV